MKYREYTRFLSTLSNEMRFAIIHLLLEEGSLNVTQICRKLGFEQSTVSHHLKDLSSCQYVFAKRKGKERVYSLNEETIVPLLKIIDKHVKKYCPNCKPLGVSRA